MLCGMTYLPPFALFGSRTAVEDCRLDQHITDWVKLLEALRDDRLDIASVQHLPLLNGALDTIAEGA